jgi:hypothetical protein
MLKYIDPGSENAATGQFQYAGCRGQLTLKEQIYQAEGGQHPDKVPLLVDLQDVVEVLQALEVFRYPDLVAVVCVNGRKQGFERQDEEAACYEAEDAGLQADVEHRSLRLEAEEAAFETGLERGFVGFGLQRWTRPDVDDGGRLGGIGLDVVRRVGEFDAACGFRPDAVHSAPVLPGAHRVHVLEGPQSHADEAQAGRLPARCSNWSSDFEHRIRIGSPSFGFDEPSSCLLMHGEKRVYEARNGNK